MYLHIGKNCVIKNNSVIGVFNIKCIENTKEFQDLFNDLNEKKRIINISNKQEKSFVLTEENKLVKAYVSNIGTNAISKRQM